MPTIRKHTLMKATQIGHSREEDQTLPDHLTTSGQGGLIPMGKDVKYNFSPPASQEAVKLRHPKRPPPRLDSCFQIHSLACDHVVLHRGKHQ